MRAAATLITVLFVLVGATAAARGDGRGMKPEARVHYERGLKLYEHHQYDEAIGELRAGLAIDPQPDLLYALGQAERRRGNCERAIEYYQACLGLVKEPAAVAALRVQIERCKVEAGEPKEEPAQLPAPAAPVVAAPPAVAAPPIVAARPAASAPASTTPPPPSPPSRPTRARWSHDALGWSLVAVGLAAGGAGGAMMGVAHARLDEAGDSYQAYADAAGAPALWTAGVVTVSVGGALVVGGVVRLAIIAAREAR